MARVLVKASAQFLETSNTGFPAASAPLTLAAWIKPTSTAISANAAFTILAISNTVGQNYFAIDQVGSAAIAGSPIRANTQSGGTAGSGTKTGTTAAWHHAAGVFASASSRTAYLDGVGGTANTTSVTPSGAAMADIGCFFNSGIRSNMFDGSVAEATVWNVALTASEIAALATGINSRFIRSSAIIGYWPLWGLTSPEPDVSGGGNYMNVNAGAAAGNHAPVTLWTRRPQSAFAIPAIAGGDTLFAQACL